MPYAVARIFSGSTDLSIEQLSGLAIKELASKLGQEPGFIRYSTIEFTDGRVGSFSVYQDKASAQKASQIATEWARSDRMRGFKLAESMEGEVGFTIQGSADSDGRLYAVARIYKADTTLKDLSAALDKEAGTALRDLPGLARYSAAKLSDGRVACFSAFANKESAEKSTVLARELRDKPGSQLATLLPSDPQLLEGTVLQTLRK